MRLKNYLNDIHNLDILAIGNCPGWLQASIISACCLSFTWAVWVIYGSPVLLELQKDYATLSNLEAQQLAIGNATANNSVAEKHADNAQTLALYNHINHLIPNNPNVNAYIHNISNIAAQHHLKLIKVKLKAEKIQNNFSALPIELNLSGKYHNFGKFLADLAILNRFVLVDNMQIVRLKQIANGNLKLKVTTRIYFYVPSVTRSGDELQMPADSVFTADNQKFLQNLTVAYTYNEDGLAEPFTPLETLSKTDTGYKFGMEFITLDNITLMGIIQVGKEKIACIQDSNGSLYKLKIGDLISNGKVKVKNITKNRIDLVQMDLNILKTIEF